MSTHTARVTRLEQRRLATDGAFCQCPGPVRALWHDEPAGPAICERCGRPVQRIVLHWGDAGGEDAPTPAGMCQ